MAFPFCSRFRVKPKVYLDRLLLAGSRPTEA